MKNFIQRYELPSFFLLAYLLSWLSVPLLQGGETTWGLAIAARIVISATLGAQGVREHYKRAMNWRVSWWYLIAPLIVIAYTMIGFGLNLILGAKFIAQPHMSLNAFILLVLFGGQWEELGWTAYALPRLQERFANHPNGRFMAGLVLSVFRAIWHCPPWQTWIWTLVGQGFDDPPGRFGRIGKRRSTRHYVSPTSPIGRG